MSTAPSRPPAPVLGSVEGPSLLARPEALDPDERGVQAKYHVVVRRLTVHRPNRDTLVLAAFAMVGLVLRLWQLGVRPIHHDESLHGSYTYGLMGAQPPHYYYDPLMHGPLQFHMYGFFFALFGSSPFALRLWPVCAGTALILAPWLLHRQLGRTATYALMTMFCWSPVLVYFSRFAREDMQVGLFTFLMVVAIIRYVGDRAEGSPGFYRWLYLLAVSFILSYAGKEDIYLTVVILGSFLAVVLIRECVQGRWLAAPALGVALMLAGVGSHHIAVAALGAIEIAAVPLVMVVIGRGAGVLSDALRSTPWRAWLLAVAIIGVVFTLIYWPIGEPASWGFIPGAHMGYTPNTLNGVNHPLTYSTDGFTGGISYWIAQQGVARGDQPWYYYLLIIPLYEWFVVLFGIVGSAFVLLRSRTFMTLLVLWWTMGTFAIYSWASEMMPWLSLHLVIPLAVLAAIAVQQCLALRRPRLRRLAIAAMLVTGIFSVHNTLTLAYADPANPVELMVYTQTTQDVPAVFDEIQRVQQGVHGPIDLMVDNEDEWPWVYYLRDHSRFVTVSYPITAAGYASANQPVLVVSATNYATVRSQFAANYVAFHEALRAWGPEEYKTYAERLETNAAGYAITDAQGNTITEPRLERLGNFLRDAMSPSSYANILRWEVQRRPFTPTAWQNDANQTIFYFLVRKDLVRFLSPSWQAQAAAQVQLQERDDPFSTLARTPDFDAVYGTGAAGVSFGFAGPVATDRLGDVYVVDTNASKILKIGPRGNLLTSWGAPGYGTAPGLFHFQYRLGQAGGQTSGIAVAPNGDVYVSDTWNERIQEFTAGGAYVRAWGKSDGDQSRPKPGEFFGPRGLAVAPNGDVYVADTGNRRIQAFDANGRFLFSFGRAGSGTGQLLEPSGLAVGPDSSLYVADFWNKRIQVFDLRGRFLRQFPVSAWQNGSYDEPSIAVDARGRVYVPDPAGARVLVFGADGKPYRAWGGALKGALAFNKPLSAAIAANGQLLLSDGGTGHVLRFRVP